MLVVAAGTNYVMDYAKQYKGQDPHARIMGQLDATCKKTYEALKTEHVKDFQPFLERVTLDLGKSSDAQKALPMDKRVKEAVKTTDPELEALMFQYGRYLLLSCSRPGSLPANLQGLWNDSNTPPWHSDYHTNINIQMNYWPAEVANLSDCHFAPVPTDHKPIAILAQTNSGRQGIWSARWKNPRLCRAYLAQHHRRNGLELGQDGKRLVLPALLGTLRLHRR